MNVENSTDDLPLVKSKTLRIVLVIIGFISLVVGVVGIFLPVLPTTPFILLSAACYAKSSPRFYKMLLSNRFFGKFIKNWRTHRALPLRTKVIATLLLGITVTSSVCFFVPFFYLKIIFSVIAIGVTIYIWRLPTL